MEKVGNSVSCRRLSGFRLRRLAGLVGKSVEVKVGNCRASAGKGLGPCSGKGGLFGLLVVLVAGLAGLDALVIGDADPEDG